MLAASQISPQTALSRVREIKDPEILLLLEVRLANKTLGELLQRIADHEKEHIDQLKADALKRENERAKQSGKPSKKSKP